MHKTMPQKLDEYLLVSHMNEAFGNPKGSRSDFVMSPIRSYPPTPLHPEKWQRLDRQLRNVADEMEEFIAAVIEGNVTKVRDALCDIRVFAYGGLHFMGYESSWSFTLNTDAPIPHMLSKLNPITALQSSYQFMMAAVREQDFESLMIRTRVLIWVVENISARIGIDTAQQESDMLAVINGVMTRFIKDDVDLEQTIAKFKAKGVQTFYTEGSYPTMILKSDGDYPDAPKGKFLKAVSYQDTVFAPLANEAEVETAVKHII